MSKVESLAFRVVGDFGGSLAVAMGYLGDRLGLFRALAGAGRVTSADLARKAGLNERYVREWLKAMVAAEYVEGDPAAGTYWMTEEQAAVLADETFPMFVGGALEFAVPAIAQTPRLKENFRKGGGIPYAEMGPEVVEAIERFFRPGYVNFLAKEWLAAVPGLVDRLRKGVDVADVGCGCGQSTVAMAKAYPMSKFTGVDNDAASLDRARDLARREKAGNARFERLSVDELAKQPRKYDLVCAFDCVHDMVNPRGALKAIRASLAKDGVFFWSEPNASDNPLENRNPVGKVFANISPLHCMTVSLAHGGEGLGTVIGERGARALADEAGFAKFEKLPIANPFNQFFALRA